MLRNGGERNIANVAKKKLPGPAGLLPEVEDFNIALERLTQAPTQNISSSQTCPRRSVNVSQLLQWRKMCEELEPMPGFSAIWETFNIRWIKENADSNKLFYIKVPFLTAAIVKVDSVRSDISQTFTVITLKDHTGEIESWLEPELYKEHATEFILDSVLVLRNVSVISINGVKHYLNITANNLVAIYCIPQLPELTQQQQQRNENMHSEHNFPPSFNSNNYRMQDIVRYNIQPLNLSSLDESFANTTILNLNNTTTRTHFETEQRNYYQRNVTRETTETVIPSSFASSSSSSSNQHPNHLISELSQAFNNEDEENDDVLSNINRSLQVEMMAQNLNTQESVFKKPFNLTNKNNNHQIQKKNINKLENGNLNGNENNGKSSNNSIFGDVGKYNSQSIFANLDLDLNSEDELYSIFDDDDNNEIKENDVNVNLSDCIDEGLLSELSQLTQGESQNQTQKESAKKRKLNSPNLIHKNEFCVINENEINELEFNHNHKNKKRMNNTLAGGEESSLRNKEMKNVCDKNKTWTENCREKDIVDVNMRNNEEFLHRINKEASLERRTGREKEISAVNNRNNEEFLHRINKKGSLEERTCRENEISDVNMRNNEEFLHRINTEASLERRTGREKEISDINNENNEEFLHRINKETSFKNRTGREKDISAVNNRNNKEFLHRINKEGSLEKRTCRENKISDVNNENNEEFLHRINTERSLERRTGREKEISDINNENNEEFLHRINKEASFKNRTGREKDISAVNNRNNEEFLHRMNTERSLERRTGRENEISDINNENNEECLLRINKEASLERSTGREKEISAVNNRNNEEFLHIINTERSLERRTGREKEINVINNENNEGFLHRINKEALLERRTGREKEISDINNENDEEFLHRINKEASFKNRTGREKDISAVNNRNNEEFLHRINKEASLKKRTGREKAISTINNRSNKDFLHRNNEEISLERTGREQGSLERSKNGNKSFNKDSLSVNVRNSNKNEEEFLAVNDKTAELLELERSQDKELFFTKNTNERLSDDESLFNQSNNLLNTAEVNEKSMNKNEETLFSSRNYDYDYDCPFKTGVLSAREEELSERIKAISSNTQATTTKTTENEISKPFAFNNFEKPISEPPKKKNRFAAFKFIQREKNNDEEDDNHNINVNNKSSALHEYSNEKKVENNRDSVFRFENEKKPNNAKKFIMNLEAKNDSQSKNCSLFETSQETSSSSFIVGNSQITVHCDMENREELEEIFTGIDADALFD